MKTYQKIFATGALIATIALVGCKKDNYIEPVKVEKKVEGSIRTIEGIVKEEFELSASLVPSNGGILSGESTRIQKNYGFVLETPQGDYTLGIEEHYAKPVEALANRIKVGSKIKIIDNINNRLDGVCFDKDKIGYATSDKVEVLE